MDRLGLQTPPSISPTAARTGGTSFPPVDAKNPDARKRNRKILGLRIFAMTADGQGDWSGAIYNSDDGQTYAGKLVLQGAQLEVHGCAGALCGSETWRRVGK